MMEDAFPTHTPELNLYEVLPAECTQTIYEWLDEDSLFFLGKTCKRAREDVAYYFRSLLKHKYLPDLHTINKSRVTKRDPNPKKIEGLYHAQIKGLLSLNRYPDQDLFLQSPMGSGKTLLMLFHAIRRWKEHGIRTIIVGTTKSFTTWWEHLTICGLNVVKSRPDKSDVLVMHSSCGPHRALLVNKTPEELAKMPYYIILVASTYLCTYPIGDRLHGLHNVFTETVVDESHLLFKDKHKAMHHQRFFKDFRRNVYLSATNFDSAYKYRDGSGRMRMEKVYDMKIGLSPVIDHPVEMKCHLIPYSECTDGVRDVVILLTSDTFKARHRKVVLFSHWNPRTIKRCVDLLNQRVPNFHFVLFNNSNMRSLNILNEVDTRVVLVTTILSASEGTNFEKADAGIYINFGSREIRRARQAFGRLSRRNNINSVIHNYIMYERNNVVEYIRSALNMYYACDKTLDIEKKPEANMITIVNMCAKQGIDVYSLPKAEMITLFSWNLKGEFLPYKESDYSLPVFTLLRLMTCG